MLTSTFQIFEGFSGLSLAVGQPFPPLDENPFANKEVPGSLHAFSGAGGCAYIKEARVVQDQDAHAVEVWEPLR